MEVAQFSYKLQQLLEAGIPLLRALSHMELTSNTAQRQQFHQLELELNSGATLAAALRSIEFPPFFCSLIAFSEQHGQLAETLILTYRYYQKKYLRYQQLRKMLAYPFLVLTSSIVTMVLILFFLLPQFASLYETLGISQSGLVHMAIQITRVEGWMEGLFIFLLIIPIPISLYVYRYKRTKLAYLLLGVPVVSRLFKLHLNYVVSTQLALLSEGGIQILEICRLFREEANSEMIRQAFYAIDQDLRRGKSLSEAFEGIAWFLPIFIDLIRIAEQSGRVSSTLKSLGEQFERELDSMLNQVASYIENILLIGTGAAIFIMLFSLFYPMLSVMGQV
ncbi:MAG TPA: type II secretion system F family protein [Bacillota bacterium]|nr:type II secretion system F family protein [Bacillota bacterium]